MTSKFMLLTVLVASLAATQALAQPYVYPAMGQSVQLQKQATTIESQEFYKRAYTACLEGRGYTVK